MALNAATVTDLQIPEVAQEIERARLFDVAGVQITVGGLITAGIILAVTLALSWLVTRGLRRVRNQSPRRAAALYLLEKLAGYAILVVGVMFALSAAGLNLSSFAVFAGAIGIGVGLGLQGVVKEFVSGIFLIFDGMVHIGDYVELDKGIRGQVVEIGPRATRIRTNDNINVLVPNSRLIEEPVTNWTLRGDTRRIHIPFSVAYGADRGVVREAVLAAAKASPFTLPETEDRKSQVWLVGFGESGLDFELLVWPTQDAVKRPAAMHAAYTWAIAEALDEAGIEIPFPQTDLRIRSILGREGDEALDLLGVKHRPASEKPAAAVSPAVANDAAAELMKPTDDVEEVPEGRS
ncbi:mechanosensitive ion channel family protein [Brevundimonas aveniformis]|uniref:mechanosensitive ion channel family protein n=1 Tax=Brevundimonas aveniformis TaxID=370977 RepID=UPI0004095191|nr:mechanosensitive ion channel domain-containing protein [Brevundimonas aveniformis]